VLVPLKETGFIITSSDIRNENYLSHELKDRSFKIKHFLESIEMFIGVK